MRFLYFLLFVIGIIAFSTIDIIAKPTKINMDLLYEFEPNFGEWDQAVLWQSRLKNGFVYVTNEGLYFNLYTLQDSAGVSLKKGSRFKMSFDGKAKKLRDRIKQKKSREMHKKYQNDPKFARKNHEPKLKLENIYDDIDLEIYTESGNFRFDLTVRPGGKIDDVEIGFEGIDSTLVTDSLVELTSNGLNIKMDGLKTYKNRKKKDNKINSRFQKNKGKIKFEANGFSSQDTIIIDPVIFVDNQSSVVNNTSNIKTIAIKENSSTNFITAVEILLDTFSLNTGGYSVQIDDQNSILLMNHNLSKIFYYHVIDSDGLDHCYDLTYDEETNTVVLAGMTSDQITYDSVLGYQGTFPIGEPYSSNEYYLGFTRRGFIMEFEYPFLQPILTYLIPGETQQFDSLVVDATYPNSKRAIITSARIENGSIQFAGFLDKFTPYDPYSPLSNYDSDSEVNYISGSFPRNSKVIYNWEISSSTNLGIGSHYYARNEKHKGNNYHYNSFPTAAPSDPGYSNIVNGIERPDNNPGLVFYYKNVNDSTVYALFEDISTSDPELLTIRSYGILPFEESDSLYLVNIQLQEQTSIANFDTLSNAYGWECFAADTAFNWFGSSSYVPHLSLYEFNGSQPTLIKSVPIPQQSTPPGIPPEIDSYYYNNGTIIVFCHQVDQAKMYPGATNDTLTDGFPVMSALFFDRHLNFTGLIPLEFKYIGGGIKINNSRCLVYGMDTERNLIYEYLSTWKPQIGRAR